ncbi:hypothetical protein HK405_015440, partial [Cladochytrium tenue]
VSSAASTLIVTIVAHEENSTKIKLSTARHELAASLLIYGGLDVLLPNKLKTSSGYEEKMAVLELVSALVEKGNTNALAILGDLNLDDERLVRLKAIDILRCVLQDSRFPPSVMSRLFSTQIVEAKCGCDALVTVYSDIVDPALDHATAGKLAIKPDFSRLSTTLILIATAAASATCRAAPMSAFNVLTTLLGQVLEKDLSTAADSAQLEMSELYNYDILSKITARLLERSKKM